MFQRILRSYKHATKDNFVYLKGWSKFFNLTSTTYIKHPHNAATHGYWYQQFCKNVRYVCWIFNVVYRCFSNIVQHENKKFCIGIINVWMCTLQRYNKSYKVTNDNYGKSNNYLLPFLCEEIILGKTFK